jgi:serine/threonine protein kinase
MPATGERAGAAVLVGIGDYLRSEQVWPLRYATRDAEALAGVLIDPEICGFPAGSIKLLTDRAASRDAMAHHLSRWLPETARGAEIALVYFAGHGMIHRIGQREEGYLLPFDADPEDIVTRGILMTDLARWLEAVGARSIVICLDCCHAARVISRGALPDGAPARDMRIRPAVLQELTGRGRYLIASCDDGQMSLEAEDWGHGLFTYHLLEGIRGAGDRDGDGRVGITELFEHVAEAVERDAREMGVTQRPWSCAIGTGGVYLTAPRDKREPGRAGPGRSPAVVAIERLWRQSGAEAAIVEVERTFEAAGAGELAALLDLLAPAPFPAAIPLILRCLAHPGDEVRDRAKRVLKAFGWDRMRASVEVLAARADAARIGAVLDGLGAFEAHAEIVALLDALVTRLKGDLRNRAVLLLERKQQALDLERIADLLRQSGSPYQIRKALGQGLSTAAYLAREEFNDLDVVVRVLRTELAALPQVRAQFLDLSRQSLRLVHHNLVLTREVRAFPERHVYYVVRDHVDGVTLQKLLESGRGFGAAQIFKIALQLLQALRPVHVHGMLHGSLKPSNIFVCGEDRVVLGDLALSLRGVGLQLDRLSYDFRYAPPEMFQQGGAFGPWSDLYSLGCVLHELACGAPPFCSDNHFELAGLHARGSIEPPSRRGSCLGTDGDSFLLKLLARDAADRFSSVDLALDALSAQRWARQPSGLTYTPQPPIVGDASLIRYATDALMSVVSFTAESRSPEDTSIAEMESICLQYNAAPPRASGDETLASDSDSSAGQALRQKLVYHPQKIGRYVIEGLLGGGGFGRVYVARDEVLGREVAIKLSAFAQTEPSVLERFRRESMAVAQLDHPNIVSIFDVGEHEGYSYVVLNYVHGGNLAGQMRLRTWSPGDAARMTAALARAVGYAHAQGVIHRDLKPSNILLSPEGTPQITDFGLAKVIGEQQEDAAKTMEGMIMGTPAYMSPEQAMGEVDKVGPATDIHALGVILYELLTGRRPFQGGTPTEQLMQVRERQPEPPSRWRPDLSRDLDAVCLKCLAKRPEDRYETAAALADDLDRFLQGRAVQARLAQPQPPEATPVQDKVVVARPQGLWERLRRRFSLRKAAAAKDPPGR